MLSIAALDHPVPVVRRILLGTLLACSALTSRAAEHWWVGRTAHFEMYSSASEAESRRLLMSLEQFRANFLHLFPLRGASEPRATIVLFGRDSAFRPYKPLYEGKPKDVAGYFSSSPDEVTIAMTSDVADPNADPAEVIYHEYVHLLLHVRDAHYPLWLEEGLAEVFSTFKVSDGKVEYGLAKERHVALLQHSTLWPLNRLFAVTHESPDYNEENRIGIFYAESWAFTHYLLCGENKANAAKLAFFMQRLAHGTSADAGFREAFGTDYRAQEIALRHYLDGGGYYQRTLPALAPNIQVTLQPASNVARDFALLNLRWRVHHDADVAGRVLALLDQDPNQPRAHELLAAIAADAGDQVGAREHWRKAAELNSDNPWVYVQLVRDQIEPHVGTSMLDVRLSNDVIAPLRAWTSRALTLSPDNTDAIELAGLVEALAEKMDIRVINRIQGRVPSMPHPSRGLLALAIAHWRVKDLPGAQALVDLVMLDPEADMVTRAVANALRYRFPVAETPTTAPTSDALATLAASKGIGLQTGRVGEAARYLDQLLTERGTTAARVQFEPVVVHPLGSNQSDPWRRAEGLREKAIAGDPNAMFELAVAHACGNGVEFSPSLAREWFQKAIEHGHSLAAAGTSPEKLDPELVAQFLRQQASPSDGSSLPPLEEQLKTRIAEVAAAAPRHNLEVLYQSAPRYPDELRHAGKDGVAIVYFTIRPDGHPADVHATQFTDSASAGSAEACVNGWRFIPTIRDGRPVTTYVEVKFTFGAGQPTPGH